MKTHQQLVRIMKQIGFELEEIDFEVDLTEIMDSTERVQLVQLVELEFRIPDIKPTSFFNLEELAEIIASYTHTEEAI